MTQQFDNKNGPRVEFQVPFRRSDRNRRQRREGHGETQAKLPHNELPRLTRLLALAHRWNRLVEDGVVANYTEIARMMGLSRARVSQIMDLLYLAPEIQGEILLRGKGRPATVPERTVRSITGLPLWKEQCNVWKGTIGDDY